MLLAFAFFVVFLFNFASPALAAFDPGVGQARVPLDIYQWVQSSARMNYFFNKNVIRFATAMDGHIDLGRVFVPVLRTFDLVQVQDIIAKRRYYRQPWRNLGQLAASAEHVTIDLKTRTVTIHDSTLLSFTFDHLFTEKPNRKIELDKLGEKSYERRLYEALITYAGKNRETLIKHSKGKLSQADKERLEREAAEKAAFEAAEKIRLEKEAKAAEKARRKAERRAKREQAENE